MKDTDAGIIQVSGRWSQLLLIVVGFACTAVISFVKYLTGPEWALSAFYIFPIILVTWNAGIRMGVLISVVSAVSWLVADVMMLETFSFPLIPYINEMFRLVVFLVISMIIFKLKTAIENQKELAGTDPLTSVLNRRAFYTIADLELNSARRYQTTTSFLYLDVDNFKKVNDRHGHQMGDKLLCSVAESIKKNIRSIDVVVRFGGDEFGVLLTRTDAAASLQVVRKIKDNLLELVRRNGWPVTFSIGVATFPAPPETIDIMIDAADAQMYMAKQAGKNRIRQKTVAGHNQNACRLERACVSI